MTRAERQDGSPAHQPKPSWGPGKNAALSFAAFAAIFGIFAYAERDTTVGHASVTHDISGAIGTAVGKTRNAIMTLPRTDPQRVSPEHRPSPGRPTRTPASPPVPPPQVASTSAAPEVSTVPPVTLAVEPEAAPRPLPMPSRNSGSRRSPPVTLAAGTHAASAYGRAATRHGAAHRAQRAEALAGTSRRMDFAPKPRPDGSDTMRRRPASRTRSWKARVRWRNALVRGDRRMGLRGTKREPGTRDRPKNSESRALLGQAIRNRL